MNVIRFLQWPRDKSDPNDPVRLAIRILNHSYV
jgi:hypothetical protein